MNNQMAESINYIIPLLLRYRPISIHAASVSWLVYGVVWYVGLCSHRQRVRYQNKPGFCYQSFKIQFQTGLIRLFFAGSVSKKLRGSIENTWGHQLREVRIGYTDFERNIHFHYSTRATWENVKTCIKYIILSWFQLFKCLLSNFKYHRWTS